MTTTRPLVVSLGVAALAAALAPDVRAQGATFAEPVQLRAGKGLLGKGRMYPSPALHDLDGDGRLDVFVGDLRGHVTYALRAADGGFAAEQKLKDAEGKILDFGNW